MNNRLANQVVVVTGAGRGIGRAIALRCSEEGAKVAIASRTESELQETARRMNGNTSNVRIVPTDVTDRKQVQSLFQTTESELGDVDLLVNNAGRLGKPGPTWDTDPDDWWLDVTVNLFGVYHCCHAILPRMIQRKAGRIINMVGGGTSRPFPFASAYGTSKAAVMRFTETLALELNQLDHPIKVFALTPGFVRTAMTEAFKQTEEGQKWMKGLLERMKEGDDNPPDYAAEMVVALGSGQMDKLHGHYFTSEKDHDRLDQLKQEADSILEEDLRTLRVNK